MTLLGRVSPIYPGDNCCSLEGKKTLKQQNSNQKQLLSQTPRQQPQTTMNTKAEAQRLFWFRAGFTGWTMPKPAAHSEPELCYSLGINPQQQFAASVLLFTLKSVSRKVSGLFRHPSTGKYLPSRGTRNTDVAFVNSALKTAAAAAPSAQCCSISPLLIPCDGAVPVSLRRPPRSLTAAIISPLSHTVTLPQCCRPEPIQTALVVFAAPDLSLLWCLFICSSKPNGIWYLNYFWLNPLKWYWNVWNISTLYDLYAHLSEMTSMHTHIQIFLKQTHFFPPNKTLKYSTDILFHLLRLPLKAIHNTLW